MKTQDFIQLLKQHSVNSLHEKWEQDVENFPPSVVKWLTECCHNIAFAQPYRLKFLTYSYDKDAIYIEFIGGITFLHS